MTDEWGLIFVATEPVATARPRPRGPSASRHGWVTLEEALAMIDDGRITDAMSQAGLLRVALERAAGAGEAGT